MEPSEIFSGELVKTVCNKSLTPKEELDQNFLIDWNIPKNEASYAKIDEDDSILEIGPGFGILTCILADQAKKIITIEKDTRFRPILSNISERYEGINIIYDDVLEHDLNDLRFNKVVANLPYGISLPILFELVDIEFDSAILLIQEDLAERLTKSPGDKGYNRLSVQFYRRCNINTLEKVDEEAFYPPPDVSSEIIRIDNIRPKFDIPSEEFFRKVLMFLFSQRDNSIRNSLYELSESTDSIDLSTTDLVKLEKESKDIMDKEVKYTKSKEFGIVTRFLWNRFDNSAGDAIEQYFDRNNLYKRAQE